MLLLLLIPAIVSNRFWGPFEVKWAFVERPWELTTFYSVALSTNGVWSASGLGQYILACAE